MATATAHGRMTNPVFVFPDTLPALQALAASVKDGGVSPRTLDLIHLRASQINGCSFCVDIHSRALKEAGETDERLFGVAAWRESPFFSEPERALLALTEAATRLSDQAAPVPDAIWEDVARHYDEAARAAIVISIAAINFWNRITVTTRQVARSTPGREG